MGYIPNKKIKYDEVTCKAAGFLIIVLLVKTVRRKVKAMKDGKV